MRFIKYVASFAAFTLMLCLLAFAKNVNAGGFDLVQSARIGSTVLQAGHYKAEWTGPNTDLQISIVQRGKVVATAEGQLKELPLKAPYGSVSMRLHEQNPQVDEIDFNNRTEALVLQSPRS